jgi:hypothetical protein
MMSRPSRWAWKNSVVARTSGWNSAAGRSILNAGEAATTCPVNLTR